MAIYSQVPRIPIPGGDWSYTNYGTEDILPKTVVCLDTTAGHVFGIAIPGEANAAARGLGVTLSKATANRGQSANVCVLGGAVAVADGAIAAGDPIGPSTAKPGRVVTVAAAAAMGTAQHAAGDGDDVLCFFGRV